ncbi:ParB N-terminal domain-containing protein [Pedobacter sp. 22163]|uniref:ParB N-terminal domain-containing protein n=1 Tax=Pedobacter sp. 22163 TaxID=3453883 RepID=UPI003F8585FF
MDTTNLYNGQQYLATSLIREPIGYRKHDIEGSHSVLRKSIIEKGVKSPIILNENPDRKNIIIHGVQVYRIAREYKIEELPIWYVDCSLEEENELRVLLDKKATAELSSDEIIDLIGSLSYEKFFAIDEFVSQIIDCELSSAKVSQQSLPPVEPKIIKQVLLRLSSDQKHLFDHIIIELNAKNQTDALLKLIDFYLNNLGGNNA